MTLSSTGQFLPVSIMIYLGTTGWDYKFWKRDFYPSNIVKKLPYYSEISAFTELRSTYDKLPTEKKVLTWSNNSPEGFMYVSRLPHQLLQTSDLDVPAEGISEFFMVMEPLHHKHQMTMLHFPSKFDLNDDRAEYLEQLLKEINSSFSGQVLLDMPNRSWQNPEIAELLSQHSACLVGQDRRPIPTLMQSESLYYLRLVGDKGTVPTSDLGTQALDRSDDITFWVDHLKFINKKTESIFVVVDNHFSGNALNDIRQLVQEFRKQHIKFEGFTDF